MRVVVYVANCDLRPDAMHFFGFGGFERDLIDQLDLMTNKMENRHDPICGTDKYYYGEADRIRMDTVSTCKKVRFAQVNFKLPMAPKISLAQKKEQELPLGEDKSASFLWP